jgi:hypothetical protein
MLYKLKNVIMLLTSMPSGLDYFFLVSVVSLAISFIVSLLIIGIIALIKKNERNFKSYLFLWLKILGAMYGTFLLIGFIILFLI